MRRYFRIKRLARHRVSAKSVQRSDLMRITCHRRNHCTRHRIAHARHCRIGHNREYRVDEWSRDVTTTHKPPLNRLILYMITERDAQNLRIFRYGIARYFGRTREMFKEKLRATFSHSRKLYDCYVCEWKLRCRYVKLIENHGP